MPIQPISVGGDLIEGDCLISPYLHYQTAKYPVFINGKKITVSTDLSTGHIVLDVALAAAKEAAAAASAAGAGIFGAAAAGAAAAVASTLEQPIGVYPVLPLPTTIGVFVNGQRIVRNLDPYERHPDPTFPSSQTLIHKTPASVSVGSVFST